MEQKAIYTFLDEKFVSGRRSPEFIAGDGAGAGDGPQGVGERVEVVADGEEDEGALGVFEPAPVDAERQRGEQRRDEADAGPGDHPGLRERLVVGGEEDVDVTPRNAGRRVRRKAEFLRRNVDESGEARLEDIFQ